MMVSICNFFKMQFGSNKDEERHSLGTGGSRGKDTHEAAKPGSAGREKSDGFAG